MRIGRALAAAASIALLALSPISPAYAYTCNSGAMCNFRHADYKGGQVDFKYYIPDFWEYFFEGTYIRMNDNVSSVVNRGVSYNACLYEHSYGKGRKLRVNKGTSISNLKNRDFNDIASSGYFQSYRSSC